jgi:hypothetical protein
MQGPSGGDPFTFHHALTPFFSEKQERKKERTKNVCAHLPPTALAYLLSKSITHFHNQQYPEKKIKRKQKYHHKITRIEKEPHDKRKMEAPTHRNKKIHLKALKFPTTRLLLGTRCRALL